MLLSSEHQKTGICGTIKGFATWPPRTTTGTLLARSALWPSSNDASQYLYWCRAAQCLQQANVIEQHDTTFVQLGKVYALQAKYQAAVAVCLEALQFSPDNAEVLTTIGLLYLRMGENLKAFDFLGNSLSNDPRSVKTILAAASVIQASCHAYSA